MRRFIGDLLREWMVFEYTWVDDILKPVAGLDAGGEEQTMNLTRRELAILAGMGLSAGRTVAAVRQEEPGKRIGYCIIGLGRISMGEFMPGVKISKNAKITALVSGHRDKAEKVAAQYGVPEKNIYDYKNMDHIVDNKDIDAVYVALPNSMHAEYTIRSAQAGKHVLCEKPMANTVADCEQMIAACKKANKKLMIAYRCQYEPTNLKAIQLVRDGKIGKLELVESSFGFNIAKGEWRTNNKMAGGGPMMDVGIYSLNACRYITGEDPVEVSAFSSVLDKDGRFDRVEENLVWSMRFPSGVLASCSTSYGGNPGNYYRAIGSQGVIQVEPAFSYEGLHIKANLADKTKIDEDTNDPNPQQFQREADHFAECIVQNKEPRTSGEEGLKDMKVISAIYQSCAEKRFVTV